MEWPEVGQSWTSDEESSDTGAYDRPGELSHTDHQVGADDSVLGDVVRGRFTVSGECSDSDSTVEVAEGELTGDGGEVAKGELIGDRGEVAEVELIGDGFGVVWGVEHVIFLRRHLAVWGHLSGCLSGALRQSIQLSVPLLISRAELEVLSKLKSSCQVASVPLMSKSPALIPYHVLDVLSHHERQCLLEQRRWIRVHRHRQLLLHSSHIVAGKLSRLQRRISGLQGQQLEDQQQLRVQMREQLLSSVREPSEDQCYQQLYRQCPLQLPTVPYVGSQHEDSLAVAVYVDLWRRGYWLTDGLKFGGHFLAYVGDPLLLHASIIVVCCPVDVRSLPIAQLAATQRLARTCAKTLVVASWAESDDTVKQETCSSSMYSECCSEQLCTVQYRIYSKPPNHQIRPYIRPASGLRRPT